MYRLAILAIVFAVAYAAKMDVGSVVYGAGIALFIDYLCEGSI